MEDVFKHVVSQCLEKGLIKSKTIILDATHTQASSPKQRPLDVLRDAAKCLMRTVVKRHPKLEKRLPTMPHVKSEQEDAEKVILHYFAKLGESVEELLSDHEGAMVIAKYRGLFRMRIQAFVVNVERMVKLVEQKQPVFR